MSLSNWLRRKSQDPTQKWESWRQGVLRSIVSEIFPPEAPYYYDTAFSFLQFNRDLVDPLRVDLFFPDYPLAIDVLVPASSPDYREAAPFIDQESWSERTARQGHKELLLRRHQCPYLAIRHHEPVDSLHLRERVRNLLGRYP